MNYKIVEKFVSINGEGDLSGQLSVFIRFAMCNLECSYCDTLWANDKNVKYELMNGKDIYEYIKSTKIKNITLTGGEPLIQEGILELVDFISQDSELNIEIETNGSVDISKVASLNKNNIKFTMDYKLDSSNMRNKMNIDNFKYIRNCDTVKFVVGDCDDLSVTKSIIEEYGLVNKCKVYISPVFGKIEPSEIVEFMKGNKMNGVTLQIQLHKIIWEPHKRGV
ncbi:putative 7-carboxy-7-deazaguanine synthase QueE [Alkalithermobacter paradoxus]|uniref:7-carboxy-7-deazaguanine synthase n=1 Tax=Alkalithermobacter paradoxus TaxID=29349 RepID=A0A1V4IB15_9FIRM|nr:7-carboxy-7-deazaguanine synthase [[Clostridium] thermoalcaliphilum]